jgi:hypothetical protein
MPTHLTPEEKALKAKLDKAFDEGDISIEAYKKSVAPYELYDKATGQGKRIYSDLPSIDPQAEPKKKLAGLPPEFKESIDTRRPEAYREWQEGSAPNESILGWWKNYITDYEVIARRVDKTSEHKEFLKDRKKQYNRALKIQETMGSGGGDLLPIAGHELTDPTKPKPRFPGSPSTSSEILSTWFDGYEFEERGDWQRDYVTDYEALRDGEYNRSGNDVSAFLAEPENRSRYDRAKAWVGTKKVEEQEKKDAAVVAAREKELGAAAVGLRGIILNDEDLDEDDMEALIKLFDVRGPNGLTEAQFWKYIGVADTTSDFSTEHILQLMMERGVTPDTIPDALNTPFYKKGLKELIDAVKLDPIDPTEDEARTLAAANAHLDDIEAALESGDVSELAMQGLLEKENWDGNTETEEYLKYKTRWTELTGRLSVAVDRATGKAAPSDLKAQVEAWNETAGKERDTFETLVNSSASAAKDAEILASTMLKPPGVKTLVFDPEGYLQGWTPIFGEETTELQIAMKIFGEFTALRIMSQDVARASIATRNEAAAANVVTNQFARDVAAAEGDPTKAASAELRRILHNEQEARNSARREQTRNALDIMQLFLGNPGSLRMAAQSGMLASIMELTGLKFNIPERFTREQTAETRAEDIANFIDVEAFQRAFQTNPNAAIALLMQQVEQLGLDPSIVIQLLGGMGVAPTALGSRGAPVQTEVIQRRR